MRSNAGWSMRGADSAAAKLKAMISVKATVVRGGAPIEVAIAQLVPGDVVKLAAGDMIPGDVRIIDAKDLFVIQGSLTGESFPVEKFAIEKMAATTAPLELTSVAFLGTSVESGSATAVVVATGADTYLGGMAESLSEESTETAFDKGIAGFDCFRECFPDLVDEGGIAREPYAARGQLGIDARAKQRFVRINIADSGD